MSDKVYETCMTCFASEQFPGVTISENGCCNFCNSRNITERNIRSPISNLDDLRGIAEELKNNKTGQYDCLIGASGGLDSSYVIYIARKVLGLNPFVLKYDHGFNHEIANRNLVTLCETLGIDYTIIKSEQKNDLKFIKHTVNALKNTDFYWGVCSFCHYILPAVTYKYAIENDIQAILISSNEYEANLSMGFKFKLLTMVRAMFSKAWRLPLVFYYLALARYYFLRLKLEFYCPPWTNLLTSYPKPPPIKQLNISKYISWDTERMVTVLEEETGWKRPEGPRLPMRFDCKIEDTLLNYTFLKASGLTVHGIICNNLIRNGLFSKDELREAIEFYNDELVKRTEDEIARLEKTD